MRNGKRARRENMTIDPGISLEELQAMHGEVKELHPLPGSEAFSLMCTLAACMDHWPVLKRRTVERTRERIQVLRRDDRHNLTGAIPPKPQPAAPPQPPAPAPAISSSGRNFPPDWRAAYVHWGVEMRKELTDDEAALKTFRRAEAVLWKLFEAEVEGRLP